MKVGRREFITMLGGVATFDAALAKPLETLDKMSESSSAGLVPRDVDFDPAEQTLAGLAQAQVDGRTSALSLTRAYLQRIAACDRDGPRLAAVLSVNPDALVIAKQLDDERHAGKLRGPLHGIPILIKDNIETRDRIPTTAGSLALSETYHDIDAPVVARLREAGAIILGKANLSEWASMRSSRMTSGWSAVGGQTRNAYDINRYPSGSSSGSAVAVAANMCGAAVGTDTYGSIIAPASVNCVVGLKPSAGVVSSEGVVPISLRFDRVGPIARTVDDAAVLLSVMTERSAEWSGSLTARGAGLAGIRIGVMPPTASAHPDAVRQSQDWFRLLSREGAVLVDVEPPESWQGMFDDVVIVLLHEFKAVINKYLAGLEGSTRVRSLAELIEFNVRNARAEMPYFGQEWFEQAEPCGPLSTPRYRTALHRLLRAADDAGLSAVFSGNKVDVLAAPGAGPAELIDHIWGDRSENTGGWPLMCSAACVAGYPSLTVPAGFVSGLPVGISLVAPRLREDLLLRVGRMFERASAARRPPKFEFE